MNRRPKACPPWRDDVTLPEYSVLNIDTAADVVIVGGGMTGILSAYLLAKAGQSVVLLEAARLITGATAYTTAFLTQLIDTRITAQLSMFGKATTQQVWASHGAAIDLLARIVEVEHLDAEFTRCSNWLFTSKPYERMALQSEYAAMHELGFDVRFHETAAVGIQNVGAIEVLGQAKMQPLKFLEGLLPVLAQMGVRIYERTPVLKVTGEVPVVVETIHHVVTAPKVLIATYDPLDNRRVMFMKKSTYTTYVQTAQIPKGRLMEGTYEDMGNPYHYFRVDPYGTYDRLIIGGEDNWEGLAFHEQKNFAALDVYLHNLLAPEEYVVTHSWSGQIIEPSDGLPLIGETKPHQFITTGFSGNGMTYAAITAMLFHDWRLGVNGDACAHLYDPKRSLFSRAARAKVHDYTQEFTNATVRNTFKYW